MKVVLFRHAQKSQDRTNNPPLSPEGLRQAEKISELITRKKWPRPHFLLVSPRRRSQETFQVASDIHNIQMLVSELLDERQPNESSKDFRRRVQELLVKIQLDFKEQDCVFICTHFDWIEEFLSIVECSTDLLDPQYHHWGSAQWMSFQKNESWELQEFSQVK